MTTTATTATTNTTALVFGASGEQGRAVLEGLVERGTYSQVYGFTRAANRDDPDSGNNVPYLTDALGVTLIPGDLQNGDHVRNALVTTNASCIFLVTTTDLPSDIGQTTGCWNAMEDEYLVIEQFFTILKQVYEQDLLPRHVVFSTKDNVQQLYRQHAHEWPQEIAPTPMDDGSVVPHYSAKGRGAEFAMDLLKEVAGLSLTLITLPFVYSNFLGFFTPLPVGDLDASDRHKNNNNSTSQHSTNQWQISASLGDGAQPLDMMSVSDLSVIVPNLLEQPDQYQHQNIRLSACRISMDAIAALFSDLFGKDVIYNPLLPEEVANLPFASAPAMAQMCQYLQLQSCAGVLAHSVKQTQDLMLPQQPRTFTDWLLTHSDSTAFARVGLDRDAPEITSVVVFGATSAQGTSVVKGLLQDQRKQYTVRATTRHVDSPAALALKALDPERVEIVYADFDTVESLQAAADGVGGAFLVTDFYLDANRDMEAEERHAKNVIDACEASQSIQHLVFSTLDNVQELNHVLGLGLTTVTDAQGKEGIVLQMDAKAKAAAYARTKKLSVTYVLLPCYSELFLDMIQRRPGTPPNSRSSSTTADGVTTKKQEKLVLTVPLKNNAKVMCMSVDDLGPAVSNIFDSYQVYAGHEIGLVTDFVTVSEIKDIFNSVLMGSKNSDSDGDDDVMMMETESVTKEAWVDMKSNDTYMKDLGQMFAYLSHTDAVKKRHSIAKTMKLVPSARPLKMWVEQNKDNPAFREKLGLR